MRLHCVGDHSGRPGPGISPGDQDLAYPGRNKINDAFTGVSPDCLSMGVFPCACMC
jgi:hypothetical protein